MDTEKTMDLSTRLRELAQQEALLVFDTFTADTALELGLALIEGAKACNAPKICVDISAFGRCVFHFTNDNCGTGSDVWVRRKKNTVEFTGHSSLHTAYLLAGMDADDRAKWGLSPDQYAQIGGGFPLRVKGCGGMVGTITFSGLPHEQDHALIVRTLSSLLHKSLS